MESYYDHRPDMPDDYWDRVDYEYQQERDRKLEEMWDKQKEEEACTA